jgi:hypothetical protein
MTATTSLFAWFDRSPLPDIVPDPVVVLGGTGLLQDFFNRVASSGEGSLSLAVPFVGSDLGYHLRGVADLPHDRLAVTLITNRKNGVRAALLAIGSLPWRSLEIKVHSRLHAKIYVFLGPSGGGASLVGSHNFTRGGARHNDEAGVLFVSTADSGCNHLIQMCHEHVQRLSRKATPFIDTARWPTGRAS